MSDEAVEMKTKATGGQVNYYLVPVPCPRRMEQPAYQAECEDIISNLKMTFDEGCAFKAIWRSAAARLGIPKPGHDPLYDAEKVVHYGNQMIHVIKTESGQANSTENWLRWTGQGDRPPIPKETPVYVLLADGSRTDAGCPESASNYTWRWVGERETPFPGDIVKYSIA